MSGCKSYNEIMYLEGKESKAEQATLPFALLATWIYHQRADRQSDRNPNRNLNHRIARFEQGKVFCYPSLQPWCIPCRRGAVVDLICTLDATYQATICGQASGDLDEDCRMQEGGSKGATEARIEVREEADGQRAESLCDSGVGGETLSGKMVDYPAGSGEQNHGGYLPPGCLVNNHPSDGEEWNEKDLPPEWIGVLARSERCGVGVPGAIDGGAY